MVSLGGYRLKNLKKFEVTNKETGEVEQGFSVKLYKDKRLLAIVDNKASQGVSIQLVSAFKSVRRNEFDYVQKDMENLIKSIQQATDVEAVGHYFADTVHFSAMGFVDILFDLIELKKICDENIVRSDDDKYVTLFTHGSSWLSSGEKEFETHYSHCLTKRVKLTTALKQTKEFVNSRLEGTQRKVNYVVPMKKGFSWEFSFDQYILFHAYAQEMNV